MLQLSHVSLFQPSKEELLAKILKSFKIQISSIDLKESMFFDIFDLKLSPGTKSSKIDKILTEIGLSFSSIGVPRGYPVLKEGIYRIEIQHGEIKCPKLDDFFKIKNNYLCPIVLGSDSFGRPLVKDLNSLPNLLVGGTTGSGKSVLLHNFILSIIKSKSDLFLVDPKMVEFSPYQDVKEVKKIVSSAEETESLISYMIDLMQLRFRLLNSTRARNIHEYNKKSKESSKLKPIVLVIDEWADIILQDHKIQKPLCYLAQKGRAAGISIILATQRPSTNVVSGLIKANFPGRIALKVASQVDSRVIIDCVGAENINSVGVGLYTDGSMLEPVLFKSPYIEDLDQKMKDLSIEQKGQMEFSLWEKQATLN